jgi:glutamine amidotransferase
LTRAPSEIVLVDFGMGNLRNVARALERIGAKTRVSARPEDVARADRVVLPGVGAMGDCMTRLRERGLDQAIRAHISAGRPYLGICLGLHALLESGEEGDAVGLGVLPGRVARFPASLGLAVPHMGWNWVEVVRPHPVVHSDYFYFVHAYRAEHVARETVVATTEYGERFPSVLGFETGLAVQFHPEKSQRAGLALLESFVGWSP